MRQLKIIRDNQGFFCVALGLGVFDVPDDERLGRVMELVVTIDEPSTEDPLELMPFSMVGR